MSYETGQDDEAIGNIADREFEDSEFKAGFKQWGQVT